MSRDTRLIVAVARLAPQKSLEVLFDALRSVQAGVLLAVIGEGPDRDDLERYARFAGLSDQIRLLGFRKDVADYISAADVFCLSSIWEGVPLAAQEAVLLGTPVVGTDVGGMRELISNKVSGRLVPPRDPAGLAAALDEVLGDPERATTYSQSAIEMLQERFSTERMLERLRDAYVG